MNIEQIQKRLDALAAKMGAKALRSPAAEFEFRSNQGPRIVLKHNKALSGWDTDYEFFPGDSPAEAFDKAEEWVADLPTPEERKLSEFMKAVAVAIDLGRENGIDADFVNPLTVLMKKLSENAITDQRVMK